MKKVALLVAVMCLSVFVVVGCSSGTAASSTSSSSSSSTASSSSSSSSSTKSSTSTSYSSSATATTTTPKSSSSAATATSATGASSVAAYSDQMHSLYNTLTECMDAAHDAEAAGDVAAAKSAKSRSDDAYGQVLRSSAPAEAKDLDTKMRTAAASMNLLTAFYEDATIAKADGDSVTYQDDMAEIATVIKEVNTDVQALTSALQALTAKYQ